MPFIDIVDFSGGLTENYVSGAVNKYQAADNLQIEQYGEVAQLLIRPGSEIYEATDDQLPTGNQRVGTLIYFKAASKLLAHSGRDIQYFTSSWQTLNGPTSNRSFPASVDTTYTMSYSPWNKHLFYVSDAYTNPGKIYVDGSGNLQLRTAGLPDLASSPTITPGANTSKSFLYRFVYYYTYQVGTVNFEDYGPVTEVSVTNADAPNTNANAITAIPVLANGTTTNWDTSTIKVKIYRTSNAGTSFYYVGQVTNGTTTYSDTMSDATLVLSQVLYTEGDVVENDQPPLCKYVHVTEANVGVYANVMIGTEKITNRFVLSVPGDPDSVPGSFYDSVDDEITGISSIRSRLIVFCLGSVYRVEGFFDSLGRGTIEKTKISEVTGCVSSQSIVQTTDAIYWAGEDGFYWTDGYNVVKISTELNSTYKTLVGTNAQKRIIQGRFDKLSKRVYWSVEADTASLDNDTLYVLDLNFGVSPAMPFTTWSGDIYFRPTAIEFEDDNLIRGDTRGYVFRHKDSLSTDPRIDTSVDVSLWAERTIIFDYKSCALNFGTNAVRKLSTRVVSVFKNLSNLSVQINVINDDGRTTGALKPIRFRGNLAWDDTEFVWGVDDLVWGTSGLIVEQRRIPHGSLRCSYRQVEITNALINVVNSDQLGTALVDAAAKTATLINSATYKWPTQSIDYYIAFESDSYLKGYLITGRTDSVLTYSDVLNTSSNGATSSWIIRGYVKNERLGLVSYTMNYDLFGQTQDVFNKGEAGDVGDSA